MEVAVEHDKVAGVQEFLEEVQKLFFSRRQLTAANENACLEILNFWGKEQGLDHIRRAVADFGHPDNDIPLPVLLEGIADWGRRLKEREAPEKQPDQRKSLEEGQDMGHVIVLDEKDVRMEEDPGQGYIEGFMDDRLREILDKKSAALGLAEQAAAEKKRATTVAKLRDLAYGYYTVCAAIEMARCKSIDEPGTPFMVLDTGSGPRVDHLGAWEILTAGEKADSKFYAAFLDGEEREYADLLDMGLPGLEQE